MQDFYLSFDGRANLENLRYKLRVSSPCTNKPLTTNILKRTSAKNLVVVPDVNHCYHLEDV